MTPKGSIYRINFLITINAKLYNLPSTLSQSGFFFFGFACLRVYFPFFFLNNFMFIYYLLFNNKQVLHKGSHWFSVLIILLLQVDKSLPKFYVFFIRYDMAMSSVNCLQLVTLWYGLYTSSHSIRVGHNGNDRYPLISLDGQYIFFIGHKWKWLGFITFQVTGNNISDRFSGSRWGGRDVITVMTSRY